MTGAPRILVVWCPDWPVVAAGCPPEAPAAVVSANRVVAATAAAQAYGVRAGLWRREAQGRCPGMAVLAADPARDAREFEPVVAAMEAFAPGVEIVRPGLAGFATRGPSRYFGGDEELARRVLDAVSVVSEAAVRGPVGEGDRSGVAAGGGDRSGVAAGGAGCRVGVADGRFAAGLAARFPPADDGSGPAVRSLVVGGARWSVVAPGRSREHLAPLPVTTLPDGDLADLLARLGLATLGDLAALPAASVLARFGTAGEIAHRLARGLDDRPLVARVPPTDLSVTVELDPPVDRVDVAAFAARSLAAELHQRLAARGLTCTRVAVEAETDHGEQLSRLWRYDGGLGPGSIAERARWQLDGWLGRGGTTGGLTLLRLVPDELGPAGGHQLDFWGGVDDRRGISRALARVQGLLGPDAVVTPALGGGRAPLDEVRLVPWGEPVTAERAGGGPEVHGGALGGSVYRHPASASRRGERSPAGEVPPWPGRLPGPAPAAVLAERRLVSLRDLDGTEPSVSGRGELSSPPVELAAAGSAWAQVEAWAGPWPLEERWWEPGRRQARLQVVAGGVAYLLAREGGRWWVEAIYD